MSVVTALGKNGKSVAFFSGGFPISPNLGDENTTFVSWVWQIWFRKLTEQLET